MLRSAVWWAKRDNTRTFRPQLEKTLIVVTGPTASGKTELAIGLAERLGCEIISADSRQIYRGMPIGTAAPTAAELARVRHHMVGVIDPDDYYSAAMFEEDVVETLLPRLWEQSDYAILCGGAMMYIDAVVRGMDQLPTISSEIRAQVLDMYTSGGIEAVRAELLRLDPDTYSRIDLCNHRRMIHAIEISLEAGVPYSTLCTGRAKERPWRTVKIAIDHPREQLFERINARVDRMIECGLEQEAARLYHLRHLNALNTVGYKELFAVIEGRMDRDTAIARIAKNTRVYAKKQLTMMARDTTLHRLAPGGDLVERALSLCR